MGGRGEILGAFKGGKEAEKWRVSAVDAASSRPAPRSNGRHTGCLLIPWWITVARQFKMGARGMEGMSESKGPFIRAGKWEGRGERKKHLCCWTEAPNPQESK